MIIHLDQKDWIGLARGFNDVDPQLKTVATNVIRTSDSEKAIFPLSITHFDETIKRLDNYSRERLAEFMVRVSKGWAILPATSILLPEVDHACRKTLGLSEYNLQDFAIKKGLSQLMGSKVDLTSSTPLPPESRKEILEKIESPESLLLLMKHGIADDEVKNMQEAAKEGAHKIEEIRRSQSRIADNDLRHRATLAQYLISEISPKVIVFLLNFGIDPKLFANQFLKDEIEIIRFFQLMPTAYNVVELSFRRDMLKERGVHPHDLNDIMSLSIALPYSDVVVTENMWHTIIVQAKLDKLRPTRVLKSVRELSPILKSL